MIIEGAMAQWVIAEVQKGTGWKDIIVHNPGDADDETIPVLIVPVAPGAQAVARAKIEQALGHATGEPA